MLVRGGFELRKWSSNIPMVLEHVPPEHRESQSPLAMTDEEAVGTLGILWYPKTDNFGFCVRRNVVNIATTKRNILSEISKLFDPLGWLSPTIIIGKMLMQELWLIGVGWDDSVPDELANRWSLYRNRLTALESIRIPRWLQSTKNITLQLHGFCDASERAMAAVVYLRTISADGTITTRLVTAKSKVTPVKTVSIPRLELCAAQLLAKLINFVRITLDLPRETIVMAWSDSTIVLSWLQKFPSTLKTFVANRVADIQDRIDPSFWRHIKSEQNPADCASRGVSPDNLSTHELWWNGPDWLKQEEENWPIFPLDPVPDTNLEL